MGEFVRSEQIGQVRIWTLDRPSARNAIDDRVVAELEALLDEAERDRTLRAVILTGGGDAAFLSGADLKLLSGGNAELRAEVDRRVLAVTQRIEALPLPVFAALNGPVLGGGNEVALACDVRIAEEHATVTFKHAALSVTPGWGGLVRIVRAIGPSAASKLFYSAQPIDAQEAKRLGFYDEVVPKGGSRARALELASAVEQTSASAVADLKRMIKLAAQNELTQDEETRVFLARTVSRDHQEALAAFREKRKPSYEPRSS